MTARILQGLECSTIFLSQKYYDMLHECHFRITDLMMISFRCCAENAAEIPWKYRGQTVENTAGNPQVSYAKRSVYNTDLLYLWCIEAFLPLVVMHGQMGAAGFSQTYLTFSLAKNLSTI